MATNRADTLDPALLRPGRLDRKIEFPLPSRRERRLIFQTCTAKMNLGPDVDLEDCELNPHRRQTARLTSRRFLDVSRPDRLSSAEIASVVQAAGLQGTSHASCSRTRHSALPQPSVKTDMLSCRSTLRMPGKCVCPCLVHLTWAEFLSAHTSQQQTVKRSDETHEFCKISHPLSVHSTLMTNFRPMRELHLFYRVSDTLQIFSVSI